MTDAVVSSAGECAACGGFPVNHAAMYFSKSLDAKANDLYSSLNRWSAFRRVSEPVRRRVILLVPYLILSLDAIYGRKRLTEPSQVPMDRARAIWDEADRRGIRMEQLTLFRRPIDSYRFLHDGRWEYFESLPIPPELLARSLACIDDKYLFKQFLKTHRIPTAPYAIATNLAQAHAALKELHMPVVVKPRMGSNSRHTTKYIQTEAQFDVAFRSAQRLCRCVLFEEYLAGNVCRATAVGGKLVGFLQTRQPAIRGDGAKTVRELIDEKNARKPGGVSDVIIAGENEAFIGRQGYALDSVLENGKSIEIGRFGGRFSGGETREMLAAVHPKLREAVERAAQLMQAPLIGFDLIIEDPERDPDGQKWGILEANTVPYIEIHTDPLEGEPSNVAGAIWDLWK